MKERENLAAYQEEREALTRTIQARGIRDKRVLSLLERIPRHFFVSGFFKRQAYEDHPLPIGLNQTISQPYMVALMTELLEVEEGNNVLEIGTGSGYQSAFLLGLGGRLISLERLPELSLRARDNLERAGIRGGSFLIGDGNKGCSEKAPFDRIIVTAAAPEFPETLFSQLCPGGILLFPQGPPGGLQFLYKVIKKLDGTYTKEICCAVAFVPLVTEEK